MRVRPTSLESGLALSIRGVFYPCIGGLPIDEQNVKQLSRSHRFAFNKIQLQSLQSPNAGVFWFQCWRANQVTRCLQYSYGSALLPRRSDVKMATTMNRRCWLFYLAFFIRRSSRRCALCFRISLPVSLIVGCDVRRRICYTVAKREKRYGNRGPSDDTSRLTQD